MFLGRFQQGEQVAVLLQCVDQNGQATVPDLPPAVCVYFVPDSGGVQVGLFAEGTKQIADRMHVLDRYGTTGLFRYLFFLNTDFPVGNANVVMCYRLSGKAYAKTARLQVIEGGDPNGCVISMTAVQRPTATYLIQMTDGGTRVFGRNPHV